MSPISYSKFLLDLFNILLCTSFAFLRGLSLLFKLRIFLQISVLLLLSDFLNFLQGPSPPDRLGPHIVIGRGSFLVWYYLSRLIIAIVFLQVVKGDHAAFGITCVKSVVRIPLTRGSGRCSDVASKLCRSIEFLVWAILNRSVSLIYCVTVSCLSVDLLFKLLLLN